MVQINIEKKDLWLLAGLMVLLMGVTVIIAANPTTKPNPGHDSTELTINVGGTDKTLQAAIDDGSLGGGIGNIVKVETTNCWNNGNTNTLEAACSGSSLIGCSGGLGKYESGAGGGFINPDLNNNKCVMTVRFPRCNNQANSYELHRIIALCS